MIDTVGLMITEMKRMIDDHQSKPERIAQVGIFGGCFVGCAFLTAILVLVGCWILKLLWNVAFG
ncbi:hypothetical protein PL1_49 [Lactobacillus phage PL-1]|uniref:Uncharacterized protein n=2 Tax=Junavirus TaxID=2843397 RepID=U5U3U6_9CAUD|nr:hypothetical protein J1_53 [Lactobacillus phage J-1]YP_008767355.1 hypothetical protein PL1_49 [Lactobacillus phage PL-1]AGZ17338.1 hypothetical protein J1_53 [Lactobacillus phage J-1]AGZ17400.1 hypothetical protein PL1_49 [Lactobacillus phage PL-1]